MFRNLSLIAAGALALVVCLPVRGQDSPSLGDLARQAQKDKTTKPAVKVFTNDDMPSGSAGSAPAAVSESAKVAPTAPAGAPDKAASPTEGFEKLQSLLDQLASMDRTTLANFVLEGHDANFRGRATWEEKLFAAKEQFVSNGRILAEKARQIQAATQAIKDVQDPNDPRVKNVAAALQQLGQANQQNSAAFQAVIAEGLELAGLPAPH